MLRAQRQATAGDWPNALRSSEQAVAMWPLSADTTLALGKLYQRRAGARGDTEILRVADDFAQAQMAYQAALRLRPTDFITWMDIGELYAMQALAGDNARAVAAQAAFERAASLAPTHARLYIRWGEVQFALADSRAAREAAAETIQYGSDLDATDGYAFLRLGDARRLLGQIDAAQAAYRQAAYWSPELAPVYPGEVGVVLERK